MAVGRIHYIPSNQLTLNSTGEKARAIAPNFQTRLIGVTLYFDAASLGASPAFAFKLQKISGGTTTDITSAISVPSSQLVAGNVVHFMLDGVNAPTGYYSVSSSSSPVIQPGDAVALTVTTASNLTTLTGYATLMLQE